MHPVLKRLLLVLVVAASVVVLALTTRGGGATPVDPNGPPPPLSSSSSSAPSSSAAATQVRSRSQGLATDVQSYAYGRRGYAATGDKSQTKLWWANGSWWAVMVNPRLGSSEIYRLDAGDAWVETGVLVDARERTYADVDWTGEVLYVASRTGEGDLVVTKFAPAPGQGSWRLVDGFPVTVAHGGATSLSIASDSTDRVWAVFNRGGRIWATVSTPGGRGWREARPLSPVGGVKDDDTAAAVAFAKHVGVMWSDQVTGAFHWAEHADADPARELTVSAVPVMSGLAIADGHIRLLSGPAGRVYAAVKTSLDDLRTEAPNSPQLMVLARRPNGTWQRSVAATVADKMTRPQILLSADGSRLYFIASSPAGGGVLYLKVAETDRVVFGAGRGTPLLAWPGAVINNATVSRQPVTSESGLVVLASDAQQAVYYFARLPVD